MLISLQLVGTPQGPVAGEPARSFEDELITIGRAPNCHMVLPDGLRIISRQHARLSVQGGEVLLACLSASAPVRVNEVGVPHGGVFALRSGDLIHIGGFDLRLSTAARASAAPARPPVPAAASAVSAPVPPPGPAAKPAPVAAPVSAPIFAPAPALKPPPEPAPARRGRLDEWFDLGPAESPIDPAAAAPAALPANVVDLDLRSGAYAPAVQPAERRVFETLQSVLTPLAEASSPLPAAALPAVAAPPLAPPPVPMPPALPDSGADLVLRNVPTPIEPEPESGPESGPEPEPAGLPALVDDSGALLMQAFLEGAGLAPRSGATNTQMLAPMALTPAWMRHIGELLRACVEGSLALLHSRSTVKREMRAEVTVIGRRQNNPLKFAPDALAALAHLVVAKRSPGFLEPVAALKDAHEDLLVHHLAVVAGMRAAMFELIARLGPDDVLREEGAPKGLGLGLPTLHEAALWRRYRQRHAEMTARLDDDFETVFGREFTKAYEAQARRVREQTTPGDTGS